MHTVKETSKSLNVALSLTVTEDTCSYLIVFPKFKLDFSVQEKIQSYIVALDSTFVNVKKHISKFWAKR